MDDQIKLTDFQRRLLNALPDGPNGTWEHRPMAVHLFGGRWHNNRQGHAGMISTTKRVAWKLEELGLVVVIPGKDRYDPDVFHIMPEGRDWLEANDQPQGAENG